MRAGLLARACRCGIALALLQGGAGIAAVPAAAAEREVIFMLDVSGSMPSAYTREGKFSSYDQVVQAAATKARGMLTPFRDDPDLVVSFYLFGDLSAQTGQPDLRAVRERLSPAEAITFFDSFFLPERDPATGRANYADQATYVAASVYELVADRLGVSDPCAPLVVREDQPALSVFALTDYGKAGGGENAPGCQDSPGSHYCAFEAENERRMAWLERSRLSNSLSFTHWNMGDDAITLVPPDQAVYRVSWTSKKKGQLNLLDPALDTTPTLPPLQPHVRMVRDAVAPDPAFLAAHPELVCTPSAIVSPRATDGAVVPVDLEARWQQKDGSPHQGEHRFDGLSLSMPGRPAPGGRLGTAELRPEVLGSPELVVPGDAADLLATGDHSLALTRASLCDALLSTYVNSTFLLPADQPGGGQALADGPCRQVPAAVAGADRLAPVATVELIAREPVPTYVFDLRAEGIAADAPVALSFDRWLRLGPDQDRTVQVAAVPPEPAGYAVSYELAVTRDGRPVDTAFDDLASFGDGQTRLQAVPGGQAVTVQLPGRAQARCPFSTDCPTAEQAGDYQIALCVQVDVEAPEPYQVALTCQGCGEVTRRGPRTECVTLPVQVERRPLSWCVLAVLGAIAAAALYVLVALWLRPRFPEHLVVGTNAYDLHSATERDPSWTSGDRWRRYTRALVPRWRRPTAGLDRLNPVAWLDWSMGPEWYLDIGKARHGAAEALLRDPSKFNAVLGLRAGRNGRCQLWLARLVQPDGKGEAPLSVHVRVPGQVTFTPLVPRNDPPPLTGAAPSDAVSFSLRGAQAEVVVELRQGREVRSKWTFRRDLPGARTGPRQVPGPPTTG